MDFASLTLDEEFITIAQEHAREIGIPSVRFECTDLCETPQFLQPRSFDVILSIDVIEHVSDPCAYLSNLRRLLVDSGAIYLFTPNKLSPLSFCADPHYGVAGVTLLPRGMARWYVVKVRQKVRQYDVERLFSPISIRHLVRECGLQLHDLNYDSWNTVSVRRPWLRLAARTPLLDNAMKGLYVFYKPTVELLLTLAE